MIKLVVFDLDGTLTPHHSVWEHIHESLDTWLCKGEVHLERWKKGKISYEEFAKLDAAEWKGVPIAKIRQIVAEIPLAKGAKELVKYLKDLRIKTVIISSGLDILAERVAVELEIDEHCSNRLAVDEYGKLTGEAEVVVPADGKGGFLKRLLRQWNVSPEETIAIGDGQSDIPLFKLSAISFAVGYVTPEVASCATYHAQDLREVREILSKLMDARQS